MNIFETRRSNLLKLLAGRGAKTQLAERLGTTQSHISHMVSPPTEKAHRPIHEEKAREIEAALKLSPGELDVDPRAGALKDVHRVRDVIVHGLPYSPEMLERAMRVVMETAAREKLSLEASKAALIVRMTYEHTVGGKRADIDSDYVAQLVRLLK